MTERIPYLDAIKGFAIFSVVCIHLYQISGVYMPALPHYISSYYLPLFFVVSGLFLNKKEIQFKFTVVKKFKQLIVPYLVAGTIINILWWCLSHRSYIDHYLLDESKGGFWFLITLFYYSVILAGVCTISRSKYERLLYLLLIYVLIVGISIILPKKIIYLFSISSMRKYFLFFLLGWCIKGWADKINILNKSIFIISGGAYIFLLFFPFEKTLLGQLIWTICASAGSIFYLNLFKRVRFLIRIFKFPGNYSLTIYIWHYVFLYLINYLLIPSDWIHSPDVIIKLLAMITTAGITTYIWAVVGKLFKGYKYSYIFGL